MTTAGKIGLSVLAVAAIAGSVFGYQRWSQRDLVTVQTSLASHEDLAAIVTASGEIKPKNYINLGANAMGPLTEIYVKEGDRVRKNQVVARIENTQADADVAAQKATIASAEADSAAAEDGIKAQDDAITTAQATVERYNNELVRAKDYLDRYDQMYKEKLVAKQDYEQKKADYESAAGQRKRKRGTPVAGEVPAFADRGAVDLRPKAGHPGAGGPDSAVERSGSL